MERAGYVGKTNIFHELFVGESWKFLVLPTFPTISMSPETMAQAPEVSQDSWEWLKMLVSPAVSTGTYFKTVLPQVAIEQILCTRARCFADKAGKVFASLIKVTSWSNTKLSNNRRLKTLLWTRQFMGFLSNPCPTNKMDSTCIMHPLLAHTFDELNSD